MDPLQIVNLQTSFCNEANSKLFYTELQKNINSFAFQVLKPGFLVTNEQPCSEETASSVNTLPTPVSI